MLKEIWDKLFKSESESSVRRNQLLLLGVILTVIIGGLAFGFKEQLIPVELPKEIKPQSKVETVPIKPDEIWRYRMSEEDQKLKDEIKSVRDSMKTLAPDDSKFDSLQARVIELERKLQKPITEPLKGIERIDVKLSARKTPKIDTVDTVIPAGAFAKAILLSGVDAATALASSSDPIPVLIRITDAGTLPRKFKSDLKDCHVIAGGYGDLSSERVYARLEKLTCTERLTGEIIETEVSGFVAGEDGKAGLRGNVVAKEHTYLVNSVLGGLIGGFSHTMTPRENIGLFSDKTTNAADNFKQGFGSGMSSSMDRLSKYYIDRAESLQPVIEVAAGRVVDLVFTEKAEIGSSQVKQEIARKRDAKRILVAKQSAAHE